MIKPLDESILCRAAVQLAPTATGEMMYMPGGVQTITPFGGGDGLPIKVLVDAGGAAALNAQHAALAARGKRPFFDFNHEDGPASFWPSEFFFREAPEPGIYCRGEWTASGKQQVDGREWRQFSPVFHVDNKRGNPARIVCRERAKPNMGGLVNDPAFHTILPLWAKHFHGNAAGENQNKTDTMTEQELAALRAKNQELQNEVDALKAKAAQDTANAALASELKAKEAELKLTANEIELEALKAKNKTQGDAILARNKADAEAEVKAAVARGAIAPKDTKTQDALVAKAAEDPGFLDVIKAMQGNSALAGRITPGGAGITITQEAPNSVMKAYAALVCKNSELPLSHQTSQDKGKLAREAAALFAKEIEGNKLIESMSLDDAIKAADNTNAAVGLLAGTLTLQRALPLMAYEYPILGAITSDFSDAPGLYGQAETTRIILKPAVQTRGTAVDSAGRPTGWTTVSPAQSVDVSVTLDEHVGVPIVFGQTILASTVRNLFAEVAPQAVNALGDYCAAKLTALMTAANFNAYKGTSLAAGATTSGSTTVTVTSTANAYVGAYISGTGIPSNTYVAVVVDATTLTLTQAATATGTGLTLTLSNSKVPTTYATYVKALASFAMSSLSEIAAAFDVMEVPMQDRFALLNSPYFTKLSQDSAFNTFYAAMHKPEIITDRMLPRLQGITPINAPWFPTSSNRTGFSGHKASLILKSRLPNDITSAVGGGVPGSVTTVSAPGGISVLLVQYVSLREGYAEWRPEVMLGAAVGDRRAGMVITSA